MNRRLTRAGGFTLVELIAVMILIGIMSVTAIPTLSNLADTRKAAGAAQVLRDIHFARQRAVARGTRTWIAFDVDGDSYALYAEDPANPGKANRIALEDRPADGGLAGPGWRRHHEGDPPARILTHANPPSDPSLTRRAAMVSGLIAERMM